MLLKVKNLETCIGQFHILQGVNLEVPEDRITVLLGRNGAGKTTTLRSIMGFTPATQGSIEFLGQSITSLPTHLIARQGIGYVPEDQGIFTDLSVEENLSIALRSRGSEARERIDFVLELFPDLRAALGRKGGHLSGGQRQMLSIGRAFVNSNRLILIDEPSKGLAPIMVEKLAQALIKIKEHTTIILVEQNFAFASKVGDRYYILDDGRTVMQGEMSDLLQDVDIQKRYLGLMVKGRD